MHQAKHIGETIQDAGRQHEPDPKRQGDRADERHFVTIGDGREPGEPQKSGSEAEEHDPDVDGAENALLRRYRGFGGGQAPHERRSRLRLHEVAEVLHRADSIQQLFVEVRAQGQPLAPLQGCGNHPDDEAGQKKDGGKVEVDHVSTTNQDAVWLTRVQSHSSRNALSGSIRAARQAGARLAPAAIAARTLAAAMSVGTSVGDRPNKREDAARPVTRQTGSPTDSPARTRRPVWRSTRSATDDLVAPNATRMPISWLRRCTM